MDGYLLDTNIVVYWWNENSPFHDSVRANVDALGDKAPLFISVITIGEIEFGHCVVSSETTERQAEFLDFFERQLPQKLNVTKHTTPAYGRLKASLFNRRAPRGKRTKVKRPEQLPYPETAQSLGEDENDLWIAAQAIERNLVLVSHDRGFARFRELASDLRIADWAS